MQFDRLHTVAIVFLALTLWIVGRLFYLQVVQRDYYSLFALSSHEMYRKLHPERGTLYFQDSRTKQLFPVAINKEFFQVYAVPRDIPLNQVASTTDRLISLLQLSPEADRSRLIEKLSNRESRYTVIAKKISKEMNDAVRSAELPAVFTAPEELRYYPEEGLSGNVVGFVGFNDKGALVGRYGAEGFFERELGGQGGFVSGEKGAGGTWIALAGRTQVDAENGADVVLTIDRALQFYACERLKKGAEEYKAKSGALVVVEPATGAVRALCSYPDFNPNAYSSITDLAAFNNTAIFTAYEPGSVIKAFTMGAGLDLNLVKPNTTFIDPCERTINGHRIKNAEGACYGTVTMTEVLENSVNTGVVWVQEKMGNDRLRQYFEKFGLGEKTGITLNSEVSGDISSLKKKGEIFGANGSFGQGITATPLQVAVGYAAIANDGQVMKPYVVDEIRYADGRRDVTKSAMVEQAISSRAAKLLSGMLVSVVENHYRSARIPGYYVAGKTGTAQVAEKGKYSADRTNHTFAGFAPADIPRVAVVVKFEEPDRKWAEQTALPVFHDVVQFALRYYGVPPEK